MLNRKLLVVCVILLFFGMTTIPGLSINIAIKNECNTTENIDTIDKKYVVSKRIESHGEYNATMIYWPDIIFLFGKIDGYHWSEQGDWTYLHINAIDLLAIYMIRISNKYEIDVNHFNTPIFFGFSGFDDLKLLGIWKDNFLFGIIPC
ncbi:MAG: hypothetical protein K8R68_07075 [Bacteroidales bacterium]|nr:hypothetical protein [Bacteroidales bacterium]